MIAVLIGGVVRDQRFSKQVLAYLRAAEDTEQTQRCGHGDAICRFGFLLPEGEDHLSPDEWLQRGRIDSRTVTANSAGMLAMVYYCASYRGENECPEGSERDDLEKIYSLLLHLSAEAQELLNTYILPEAQEEHAEQIEKSLGTLFSGNIGRCHEEGVKRS